MTSIEDVKIPQRLYRRDIIKTILTESQMKFAEDKSELLKDKMLKELVFLGAMGEIKLKEITGLELLDKRHYDFMLLNGYTFDVKAKKIKDFPTPPGLDFFCDIHRDKQMSDFFVFTFVVPETRVCWLTGYILREEFFDNATQVKPGYLKPDNYPNKTDKDLWCLKIKYLNPWSKFEKFYKR